jgi:hypothetical protein
MFGDARWPGVQRRGEISNLRTHHYNTFWRIKRDRCENLGRLPRGTLSGRPSLIGIRPPEMGLELEMPVLVLGHDKILPHALWPSSLQTRVHLGMLEDGASRRFLWL